MKKTYLVLNQLHLLMRYIKVVSHKSME